MLDHPPIFTPPDRLEMKVYSGTEEAEMQKIYDDLIRHLRDTLDNDDLTLSFSVVKEAKELGPATPDDKYDYFAKKNRWFEQLAQDLNLKPMG